MLSIIETDLIKDPLLVNVLVMCHVIAFLIWILTLITGNQSQMDRLWAILPTIYSWIFLYGAYNVNTASFKPRLILMTILVTLWGVRLTFIFWRRGYYEWKHEDYRWEHVKKGLNPQKNKIKFHLFNFIFMAFTQNWILLGYVLPMWFIQSTEQENQKGQPFNNYDYLLTVAFLIFLLIEGVADQQQWIFQQKKKRFQNGEKFNEGE
jgi:steroid 5-alpha reductase family enzyme